MDAAYRGSIHRLRIPQKACDPRRRYPGVPSEFQPVRCGTGAALSRLVANKENVMNLKAIIASLVLGSSSAAMAAPAVTFSANIQPSYSATVVRDHRVIDRAPAAAPVYRPVAQPIYARPVAQPYDTAGWWRRSLRPVTLVSGAHFSGDGRMFITVPDQGRSFGSLQISAAGGRTFIRQVYIEFNNGQEQTIRNLDATLTGNQSMTLDLDGNRRSIRRVVVYGKEINSGWRRSAGGFTLTAV
jgi:hypothetical protein